MQKPVDARRWMTILGGMHRVVPAHFWRHDMHASFLIPSSRAKITAKEAA